MARGVSSAAACVATLALLGPLHACVLVTDQAYSRPGAPPDDVVTVDQVAPPDGSPPACPDGLTNCDGVCVDLRTDVAHCGACATGCAQAVNATVACVAGSCQSQCRDGYGSCNGAPCDTNLRDVHHCGACATDCAPLGAGAVCRMNDAGNYVCATQCTAAQTSCGGTCVDAQSDENNCGACGVRCGTGQACLGGHCVCMVATQTLCAGACVDTLTSLAHCGGCGVPCAGGTTLHLVASCVAGACRRVCEPGFADCDGDPGNGCEVDVRVSAANCGGCALACPAGATCSSGACRGAVTCSGALRDACGSVCTDLTIDPNNCGACGRVCGGGEVCQSGACSSSGRTDCGFVGTPCCLPGGCHTGVMCTRSASGMTTCACVLDPSLCR